MKLASGVNINAIEYASQGNAVLGIRDSGKTYTATYLAERLLDEGIPFIAFDPIGVWRYLKNGKSGPGYPVVVAGDNGDLPLTAEGAADIVRAAMKENVSLIIDLYSMSLSKADWRKIIEQCISLLLYENKPHGLRHIFIEEAAEFCPQRIRPEDGKVYAAIEKLARMGGNASLGYTLINQRAEEVNKAVLELCDCLFLHRQKGRNSLTALGKWLDIADTTNSKEVINSLPSLSQGECWLWMQGSHNPKKIKILEKNTIHPDRKNPLLIAKSIPADVSKFVSKMNTSLKKRAQEKVTQIVIEKTASVFSKNLVAASRKIIPMEKSESEVINFNLEIYELEQKNIELKEQLETEKRSRKQAEQKLSFVRDMIKPEFEKMKRIFEEANVTIDNEDTGDYDIWLNKFGGKKKLMLEMLIKRKRISRPQLGVLVGMSYSSGSFNNYISELKTVGLIKKEGDEFVLQTV